MYIAVSVTVLCIELAAHSAYRCTHAHTHTHNLARNSVLPATLDSSCGESHEGDVAMLAAFIGDPHTDISSCGFACFKCQCFEGTLLL